jgi:hypothetical protein
MLRCRLTGVRGHNVSAILAVSVAATAVAGLMLFCLGRVSSNIAGQAFPAEGRCAAREIGCPHDQGWPLRQRQCYDCREGPRRSRPRFRRSRWKRFLRAADMILATAGTVCVKCRKRPVLDLEDPPTPAAQGFAEPNERKFSKRRPLRPFHRCREQPRLTRLGCQTAPGTPPLARSQRSSGLRCPVRRSANAASEVCSDKACAIAYQSPKKELCRASLKKC